MQHRIITEDILLVKAIGLRQRTNTGLQDYRNSPVILVRKKMAPCALCATTDGTMVSQKRYLTLPHIRDITDKMEDAKYWTTLDCAFKLGKKCGQRHSM